ncbi:MAG: fused MFS/spermidine synthase [Planctomycetes bacterium]|nr:fused MFS/spermidine synthase [Planctomycetota bacterium]
MKKHYPLYALVFVGGTVLMTLEITGGRLLAPFFGNDIFVWGSIIGVFMVAMALGYLTGGWLADRKPSEPLLGLIGVLAGLLMLLVPVFGSWFCRHIAASQIGPRLSPFLAAFAIFTLPSILLAMVSPFAVKLAAGRLEKLGNVAGSLYALSTTGSILGTLGTAFVLIPWQGSRIIIFFAGVVELVVALAMFIAVGGLRKPKGPHAAAAAVLLAGAGLFVYPSGPGVPVTMWYDYYNDEDGKRVELTQELKYWTESPYHLIMVTEQQQFDINGKLRRRRLLRFNDRTESAVYIDKLNNSGRPEHYESAVRYTALLHMGLPFAPHARKALFIGLGGGIGPTEFHDHYGMDVDAVDVDAEVVRTAQQWFFLKPSDSLRLHVMDGRRFLQQSDDLYDIIVLDAYSSGGAIPFHLITTEFYSLVRRRLAPDGVAVSNLISSIDGKGSGIFRSAYKTMYAAGFENLYIFPRFYLKGEARPGYARDDQFRNRGMNIITVASPDPRRLGREEVLARARLLARGDGRRVVLPRFEEYVAFLHPMPFSGRDEVLDNMNDAIVFTDDYAPTDTMYAGF